MIDFLKDKACCDISSNDDPETRDCLDLWKERLEIVTSDCNKKSAMTAKDEEEYLNSLAWRNRLENWNKIIKETDEKADIIVNELKFFLDQIKIVCDCAEVTTNDLEKLLGLVKCIFDSFFTYENSNEGLKDKIVNFKKAIECLKNVSDEDKAEVIECIETYEQKIILVCEMQDDVLTKLLETFKCAYLLCKSICGHGGLEDKTEDLQDVFTGGNVDDCENGNNHHNSEENNIDDEKKGKKGKKKVHHDNEYSYPCNDAIVKPMPRFPINQSEYYQDVISNLNTAESQTIVLKSEWVSSKEQSDKCLSHKRSLIDAINAAEAAEKA